MKIHLLIRSEPPCKFCSAAKDLLDQRGLAYTVEDHETPEKVEIFKAQGHRTFPRVYIDGYLLGGFDDLKEHLAEDDF